jgi:hypothetical protein
MNDADRRAISASVEKRGAEGQMPLIMQGLRRDLKAVCTKEGRIRSETESEILRKDTSEELAAFLKQELSNGRICGQAYRAVVSL